jgi:hypothetical protein
MKRSHSFAFISAIFLATLPPLRIAQIVARHGENVLSKEREAGGTVLKSCIS